MYLALKHFVETRLFSLSYPFGFIKHLSRAAVLQKLSFLPFIVLMISHLTACHSLKTNTHEQGATQDYLLSQKGAKHRLHQALTSQRASALHLAEQARKRGDNENALSHYLYALSLESDSKIAEEAFKLAQNSDAAIASHQAAEAWLLEQPKHKEAIQAAILANLNLARSELNPNFEEKTFSLVLRLIDIEDNDEERFEDLVVFNRLMLDPTTVTLWRILIKKLPESPLGYSLLAHAMLSISKINNDRNYINYARIAVTEALKGHPTFSNAVQIYINILNLTEPSSSATQYLSRLIQEYPESATGYSLLATIYFERKEYQQCIATVKQWQTQYPDSHQAHYLLASSYYALENLQDSYDVFYNLSKTDFNPNLTAYFCGETARQLLNIEQAIDCYKKVQAGKYWLPAQKNITQLLINQKKEEEALARLETLAFNGLKNQAEEAATLKALWLVKLERLNDARQWLDSLIDAKLTSLKLPLERLLLHIEYPEKDREMAQLISDTANRLNPALEKDWWLGASRLLGHRDKSAALNILNEGLSRYENNDNMMLSKALLLGQMNQQNDMEALLRESLILHPNNPSIKNALGYYLADNNRELTYAMQLIKDALDIHPNSVAFLDSLGWVNYRLGKLQTAENYLRRAFDVSKNRQTEPEIIAHLIEVLWHNNKKEEAAKLWYQYKKEFSEDTNKSMLSKQLQTQLNAFGHHLNI